MSLFNLSEFMTIGILNKSKNPVFRIQSIATGEEYVLKKLQRRDFQAHLSDFAELTYILRCCQHPNIVKILGFSMSYTNSDYNLCLLMELHKTDLQRIIDLNRKNGEALPKKTYMNIIVQLIDALYFIQTHAKIAHRDLKPANILLDIKENPLITDFSEAFFADGIKNNEYREDGIKGTPEYMSPELKDLFMGNQTENFRYNPWISDVYSLGMTLINLGSSFRATSQASLLEKLSIIEEVYGSVVRSLLEILVRENPATRGDFKDLQMRKEYRKLFEEGDEKKDSFTLVPADQEIERISVILEGGQQEDDGSENDNETFGRKVECINGDPFISIIEESKEAMMKYKFESPIKKEETCVSSELRKLKNMLKSMKNSKTKIESQTLKQVFKRMVLKIKELEFENRVLLKQMKTKLKKSCSEGRLFREDFSSREKVNQRTPSSQCGFNLGEHRKHGRSMNIIYNLEVKK